MIHGFNRNKWASQSIGCRSLRLISQRMLLESVVVGSVAQVTFRLIELWCTHYVCLLRLLLMWSHDELTSINLRHATIHLDNLHKTWSLESLTLFLLHFAKNGRVISEVIVYVDELFLWCIVIGLRGRCLVCKCRTLSSLMHIAHCRNLTAWLVWRNWTMTLRPSLCALWWVINCSLNLEMCYLLRISDCDTSLFWLWHFIIEQSVLQRAMKCATIQNIFGLYRSCCTSVAAWCANPTHPTLHSLKALKHTLVIVSRRACNWFIKILAISCDGCSTISFRNTLCDHLVVGGVDPLCLELV